MPKPRRTDMLKIKAVTPVKKIKFGKGIRFNSLIK
jgi:hypothetical protein